MTSVQPHPSRRESSGKLENGQGVDSITKIRKSNFDAIRIRYIDPLSCKIKETMVVVSPSESLPNICAFVSIASRPPNQLAACIRAFSTDSEGTKSRGVEHSYRAAVSFDPRMSVVDELRSKATFENKIDFKELVPLEWLGNLKAKTAVFSPSFPFFESSTPNAQEQNPVAPSVQDHNTGAFQGQAPSLGTPPSGPRFSISGLF